MTSLSLNECAATVSARSAGPGQTCGRTGRPDPGPGASIEEVSPQNHPHRKAPRNRLSGHADLWYSGKAHAHGGNIQALFAPDGFPLWVSEAEPGSVHDLTAARIHALPALYPAAATGLPALADPGYHGAGIGIHVPVKQPTQGRDLDIDTRTRNALLRSLRCLVERGFALVTGRWRTLQHITASPGKIGDIARAALVLTHFEHGYIK